MSLFAKKDELYVIKCSQRRKYHFAKISLSKRLNKMLCILHMKLSLTLARTWGDATPGRFCALYPLFLKLEI